MGEKQAQACINGISYEPKSQETRRAGAQGEGPGATREK